MQIIILSLISILFLSCSSKKDGSTIPESNVRLLRKTNSDIIQITDKSQLETSDYVLFDTEKNKSITAEDLENENESPYYITSLSECSISGKKIKYAAELNQRIIELKSILPLEFYSSKNLKADCSFQITLNNAGSTKTFNFSKTTIKNKNTNSKVILGDLRVIEPKHLPENIDEIDFDKYTVTQAKRNEYVSLICENFYSRPIKIQSEVVKFESMARYMEIVNFLPSPVDARTYVPHQDCVIHLKRNNGSVLLSSVFKVRYAIMQPQVKFINKPYTQRDPPDNYTPFELEFTNPHAHPATIALDKTKLSLNVTVTVETCPHDKCKDVVKGNPTPVLRPQFSNTEVVIEKENAFIVHLKPNETLKVVFWTLIYDNYSSSHKIKWDLNSKKDLVQNLHTNYQTAQEIPDLPKFIGTAGSNL